MKQRFDATCISLLLCETHEMNNKRAGDFGYPVKMYLIIGDLENLVNGWEDDGHYNLWD
jgi:hypothetical protein